jgi:hypothetical protein
MLGGGLRNSRSTISPQQLKARGASEYRESGGELDCFVVDEEGELEETEGTPRVIFDASADGAKDTLREAGDASADSTCKRNSSSASRAPAETIPEAQPSDKIQALKHKQIEAWAKKSRWDKMRRSVWSFLEEPETKIANFFFQFRSVLYFTSAVLPLFGRHSVGKAAAVGEPLDDVLNSILLFEAFLRLIVCPSPSRFLSDPYHVFDCLACLPFFVRLACSGSSHSACVSAPGSFYALVGFLRPILRMLKVTRHVGGFTLLSEVLRRSAEGLGVPVFLMCLLIACFSATIYWIEEGEESFQSVPEVVWYCVVTISTVGYGDVSPTTAGGRMLGVLLILTGLAAFAMPLGVISGNFSAVYEDKDEILLMKRVQRRLKSSGIGPEKIVEALQSIDSSGDGKLDYMEFSGLLLGLDVGFSEDNSRALFDFFDDDKSGSLDYAELLEKVFPGCEYVLNQAADTRRTTVTAQPGAPVPVSLNELLRSVNDVQTRLQKMNLSLEQLSSSTESRLGALEIRVSNFDVGTEAGPPGAITITPPSVDVPRKHSDLDTIVEDPSPPPPLAEHPPPPQKGWLEIRKDDPKDPGTGAPGTGPSSVDLESAEALVEKLVDDVDVGEDDTRIPPKSDVMPKAPATPAPALPGCPDPSTCGS